MVWTECMEADFHCQLEKATVEHRTLVEHIKRGIYDVEPECSTMATWEKRAHKFSASGNAMLLEMNLALTTMVIHFGVNLLCRLLTELNRSRNSRRRRRLMPKSWCHIARL